MRNGRTLGIVQQVTIALALTAALVGNCVAGALDEHASPSTYSANPAGNANSLALPSLSRFETPIKWQSSINIAGSRVWAKFVKLSPHGINLRLPLN
jgi:hypothetical protein